MDTIKTGTYKGVDYSIEYSDFQSNPRDFADTDLVSFCVSPHSRYTFPNELNFDFEGAYNKTQSAGEDMAEIEEKYWIFPLDMYEHSGITFSFYGEGMQCRFDTSSNIGFIAVNKKQVKDEKEAENLARQDLFEYNAYCNGHVYTGKVEFMKVGFSDDEWTGDRYSTDDVLEDIKYLIDEALKNRKEIEVVYSVKIKKTVAAKDFEEAKEMAENFELPNGYVRDSFDIISIN